MCWKGIEGRKLTIKKHKKRQRVHFINIISNKGGVGKTVIGLGLANYFTRNKGPVFYMDLDFTGTNLEDGFRKGALSPLDKKDKKDKKGIYLNNWIPHPPFDKRKKRKKMRDFIRRYNFSHPKNKYELYISPSRTEEKDVEKLEPFLTATSYYPYAPYRLCRLIDFTLKEIIIKEIEEEKEKKERKNKNTDTRVDIFVIFDNSPGAFGLSKSLVKFDFLKLKKETHFLKDVSYISKLNLVVTSPDRQDLVASMNQFLSIMGKKV